MLTLEEGIYETAHHSNTPLKAIAAELDMSISSLTRAGLPRHSDSWASFPSHKINPLIRVTNNFLMLDILEQNAGRVGVSLPPVGGAPTSDVCRQTMAAVREFGELVAEVEKSLADNNIRRSECARIEKEGYEAVQAIMTLITACKAVR